jgi:hypothetical protein
MQTRAWAFGTTLALCLMWCGLVPLSATAAVPPPPVPLDDAPFGINSHLATRTFDLTVMQTAADRVAQSGAGWAREDIHWFRIQPKPDVWDWEFTDRAIALLHQRGIAIVAVIGHPPGWATPWRHDPSAGVSFHAPDPQRFAQFAAAVVTRYRSVITHWEIWNEPDNVHFWKPAPDARAYATLLKWASAAVRRADPAARVIFGGINPFDTSFLGTVAAEGAWSSFDILAIHPYVNPRSPEQGQLERAADAVRTVMDRYGTRPLWVTEIGWSSGVGDRQPDDSIDESDQADYLVRALLLLWQAGVERIFWYTLKDDPGNPYGLIAEGRGYADYSRPKPAWYAFRHLSTLLRNTHFVGLRDLYQRTVVFDFENLGSWRVGDQPNGTLTATSAARFAGRSAARLAYQFPSSSNDYVVFRREKPIPLPNGTRMLGLWVYGDGSGHTLKAWLRDDTGEILQLALGLAGPAGWRFLSAALPATVPPWDRITAGGDGRFSERLWLEALVLDDQPDDVRGAGVIVVDELTAAQGVEAYNLQLRGADRDIDIVWSPTPLTVSFASQSATATMSDWRDAPQRIVRDARGQLVVRSGPTPRIIEHQR